MNRIWKMSLVISALIIIDQLTKGSVQGHFSVGESLPLIDGFFNITYVRNSGAAFGFLAESDSWIKKPLFLYVPFLACFYLLRCMWKVRHTNGILCTAYGLFFAGAAGNLLDRFSLGYVVDFLDFYLGSSHFPAFNIADASISIAVVLLIYDFIREWKKGLKEA